MTICNRRFEVSIRVHYYSGLTSDETHPSQGINRIEAENNLLERRDRSPDARFIERVELRGCVEVVDGAYVAGGVA
jgi:hypothetical protein